MNDALRSIHEYEHALTEMGVDMSRRIDAVKAEYTKSAEPLQKRVKQLETDVQEYVEAHREDMAGKSRQLTFGRVGFRQSTRLILANAKVPQAIATLLAMGRRELVKTEQKLDKEALKQQPEEVLEAVGAYLKTTDEFFLRHGRRRAGRVTRKEAAGMGALDVSKGTVKSIYAQVQSWGWWNVAEAMRTRCTRWYRA